MRSRAETGIHISKDGIIESIREISFLNSKGVDQQAYAVTVKEKGGIRRTYIGQKLVNNDKSFSKIALKVGDQVQNKQPLLQTDLGAYNHLYQQYPSNYEVSSSEVNDLINVSGRPLGIEPSYRVYNNSELMERDVIIARNSRVEANTTLLAQGGKKGSLLKWAALAVGALSAAKNILGGTGDTQLTQSPESTSGWDPFPNMFNFGVGAKPVGGLFSAAAASNMVEFQRLLDAGVDPNEVNAAGAAILLMAVKDSNVEIVKALLAAGADPNTLVNAAGATILLRAIDTNHVEIVRALLAAGADPNILAARADPNKRDGYGYAPLSLAAERGDMVLVKLLLEYKAMPNLADVTGETPFFHAVDKKRVKISKLLLAAGADPNKANNGGVTPLLSAVSSNHTKIIKLLLNNDKIDPNKANNGGMTPLMLAAYNNFTKAVKLLLQKSKTDLNKGGPQGDTPLLFAVFRQHSNVAELLLAAGADPNQVNTKGDTPLILAINMKRWNIAKLLLEQESIDPNKANTAGDTPLLIAINNGYHNIVERLLEKGANPNKANNEGLTPLRLAVNKGSMKIVELLKAKINPPKQVAEPDIEEKKLSVPVEIKLLQEKGYQKKDRQKPEGQKSEESSNVLLNTIVAIMSATSIILGVLLKREKDKVTRVEGERNVFADRVRGLENVQEVNNPHEDIKPDEDARYAAERKIKAGLARGSEVIANVLSPPHPEENVVKLNKQIKRANDKIEQLNRDVKNLNRDITTAKEALDKQEKELKKEKGAVKDKDRLIKKTAKDKLALAQENKDLTGEVDTLGRKVKELNALPFIERPGPMERAHKATRLQGELKVLQEKYNTLRTELSPPPYDASESMGALLQSPPPYAASESIGALLPSPPPPSYVDAVGRSNSSPSPSPPQR